MSASEGKKSFVQLLKFVLIGASNTLLDLVVTFALNAIFGIYYLAKIIGYACGIVNSYIWNSRWTFREERRRDAREIVTFLAVNLITLGLSLLLQWVFRDRLHLDAWWTGFAGENCFTKIINGERFCLLLASGIAPLVNFAGNKLLVFNRRKTEQIEEPTENAEE
ncbi:MAG: GtrA family protein [Clostridia bacterium]|nr:GtrA family protein [Clostridia bacterium]